MSLAAKAKTLQGIPATQRIFGKAGPGKLVVEAHIAAHSAVVAATVVFCGQ